MTQAFLGKTVLVTGAGGGIGAATAQAFAAEGATVLVADVDLARGEAVASKCNGRGRFVRLDVGDIDGIAATLAAALVPGERIDVLVNNAAIWDMEPLLAVTRESFRRLFDINVEGMFFTMQAVAACMKQDGKGGAIINLASQAGRQAEPASSVYAATKAAVISFTRSAAIALIGDHIRVNAIAPGVIHTEMWKKIDARFVEQYGTEPGAKTREVGESVPYGRMGTPAEVAATAVFLASPQAEYIVGQTLNVDGGNILS